MTFDLPRRQRIRLAHETYRVVGAVCSITIGVAARAPIFADRLVAGAVVEVLKQYAFKTGVPVYGFCMMPDHVHLVLGPSPACDIVTFVGRFKNLAQRAAWRLGVTGAFWQHGFWDHFLRREEQVEIVVKYVLHNPVRSGFVTRWDEYPFCGSLVFDLAGDHVSAGAAGDEPPPYERR